MTLETKYNPGEEVWVIRNNKPVKLIIKSIKIIANGDTYKISYNLTDGYMCGDFNEDVICATKEDLKDKLFG